MDTFLVRTLLVPSAAVLIGRWNWWPSRLCWQQPSGEAPDSFTTYKLLLKMTSEGSRGARGAR